jgi:hypothetical protein
MEARREDVRGFLRPDKPPIIAAKNKEHFHLANKHGFAGVDSALKSGLIRYSHYTNSETGKRSADYEFHDTPAARKRVSDHLGSSGGFHEIHFDQRVLDPKTKDWDTKKEIASSPKRRFTNVEAARKHLDS